MPRRAIRPFVRGAAALGAALLVALSLLVPVVSAGGTPPLGQENFFPIDPEGWADRSNSWSWSMLWWNNKLWVGDNRNFGCVSAQAFWAINHQGYPPIDPDIVCPTNPAQIEMQATIHMWDPATNSWTQVFESPQCPPSPTPTPTPGPNSSPCIPNQNYPGYYLPPDIGFRTGTVYTYTQSFPGGGQAGQSAIFFGGVNTQAMAFGPVPPPRVLYSFDGQTFNAVPQDAGTFMGTLPNASMRGMKVYNGQIFVVNGSIQGQGPIIASLPGHDPIEGNNSWAQVSPLGASYYDLEPFNGWLYAGVVDTVNGYSVVKTQATGNPPYSFIQVTPSGACLTQFTTPRAPGYSISMHEFNGRLYVGTANPGEIIRINPDDTWDLVVGAPRACTQPDGSTVWKYPLSGLGEGYSNDWNIQMWRLGDHLGQQLYLGTYDAGIRQKNNTTLVNGVPVNQLIQPELGADLFQTTDGWYWTPVTTTGFSNSFDYGIRNFADTPYGFFFGTVNEYYGLTIYRALDNLPKPVAAPQRVIVEINQNQPVISWDPVPNATSYQVWRAPLVTVPVGGANYTFPSTAVQVGTTADTVFVDAPLNGTSYLYTVYAVDADGHVSDVSNEALGPSLTPAMTFTNALAFVTTLQQRNRFVSSGALATAQQSLQQAQSLTASGNLAGAMDQVKALDQQVLAGNSVLAPDSTDFDIVLGQLLRRLKLANSGFISPTSLN